MESKAKLFGHAIHPILIVYPLGLLSAAVIFDVLYLVTANQTWTTVSFWMIAAGIVGGLLAAVFGLIDYLNIPSGTRASRIGLLHGATNVGVMILFAASWLLRYDFPQAPSTAALALSFIGVVAALLGGWLGGELVERLGVGVTPGANLNAPNSLTHGARDTAHVRKETGSAAA
jgi:uncharacterized membrane protein